MERDIVTHGPQRYAPAAALHSYGLGVFEGLKARRSADGRILVFRVRDHARRMQQSAARLMLPSVQLDDFESAVTAVVARNVGSIPEAGDGAFYLRPLLFAVDPQLGLKDPEAFEFLVFGAPVSTFFGPKTEIRLRIMSQCRCAPGGTGAVKAIGNYAPTLAIRKQLRAEGFDDGLYTDAQTGTFVTETSGSNVFALLSDGELVTPPLDDQVLPGITRDSVLRLAREELGLQVTERPLTVEECLRAQEIFCTGTAWSVRSVSELACGEATFRPPNRALARQLRALVEGIQTGVAADPRGWTTAVPTRDAPLVAVRDRISSVDDEIVELLAERRKLSRTMAKIKDPAGLRVRDEAREHELLARVISRGREQGVEAHLVTRVFQEIIDDSVRIQQDFLQETVNRSTGEPAVLRIAFQGGEGAYSHIAAQRFFSSRTGVAYRGFEKFSEVVEAVERGEADRAFLPIENTTAGAIHEVYDLLAGTKLYIIGEIRLKVEHCLLGMSGVEPHEIRRIISHPQAIFQCSNFLSHLHDCEIRSHEDTALSAAKVKTDGDRAQAAIASEDAGRLFGLHVIQKGIQNQATNFTRFLIASREPRAVDLRIPSKTSLIMATGQKAGSLVEALLVFRDRNLEMTKLQSRPIPNQPWNEMFYLDFRGNLADDNVKGALEDLAKATSFIKVLGSYPEDDISRTVPPPKVLAQGARAPSEPEGPAARPAPRSAQAPKAYRLASREHKPEDTIIRIGDARLGSEEFVVIAGPCAVESLPQLESCARQVKEHGARLFRGGCFKPRTSPYSFQGLGFEGLDMLADVGRRYQLPIVTEVLSPQHVEAVAEKADVLQIGARNMQNFVLLREVGKVPRPVMLKRGMMASIDELLQAAEYILAQGNQQVFLCERGIRTFETATRNTLDLSAIPILRRKTHLPVIVDPSHAAGQRDLVPPLARASRAIGAQAIMVELHPNPEEALSDGPQALRFPQFAQLMKELSG